MSRLKGTEKKQNLTRREKSIWQKPSTRYVTGTIRQIYADLTNTSHNDPHFEKAMIVTLTCRSVVLEKGEVNRSWHWA